MTNFAAVGREREHRFRDYLCGTPDDAPASRRRYPGFGWKPLQRSAGSKGKVDSSFYRPGRLLLIQVKRSDPQVSPAERRALIEIADCLGMDRTLPVTACWPVRARVPSFRLLTGPGPKDWIPWDPEQETITMGESLDGVQLV